MSALAIALALASLQTPTVPHPLFQGLKGAWVGYLEYQDYQGPGRVRIAVMCRVTPVDLYTAKMRLVFDEGPSKIMEDNQTITLDLTNSDYIVEARAKDRFTASRALTSWISRGSGRCCSSGKARVRTNLWMCG